ncbi:AraC family transcriptional regulator [Sediminitomix flava]|uniref:AraC-like DNA-binding protein n=1 Tax=Sediminitomix flava TaxID=379075 RepID=A0A315ZE43_SEDFL|nr:AraC family transcriptional regulator [Sediminitomix flava]PWJ43886.1 AraC-like DNA-binding protein [Sediminitomix flava]
MKAYLEKVVTSDESNIRAFHYSENSFETPWHVHPEFELTYVLNSHGVRYVGNNISEYEPLELVLLGSNLPHCWKKDIASEERAESLVIQWSQELMDGVKHFKEIQFLMKNINRGILFKNADLYQVRERMEAIIEAHGFERMLKFLDLLKLLSTVEVEEVLAGASYAYDFSSETNSRIEMVQNFVAMHYPRKIKLAEIAEQLNMTEQSFSRFFSKAMQRPFFVYLNEYRVNRASRLLLETDMQVAEIGYQCGYESLPFFYQQFKKFKNYSPLGFRKMYRNMVQ